MTMMEELSELHKELTKKLKEQEELYEKQKLAYKECVANLKVQADKKISHCFGNLNQQSQSLMQSYETANKDPAYFYQHPLEEISKEEDQFTLSLADYTRKQFFQGIADLAHTQDETEFSLLDTSKPESLFIRGESDSVKEEDRRQLIRLQSEYVKSEEKRLESLLEKHSVQAALNEARKQYKLVTSGAFDPTDQEIEIEIEKRLTAIKRKTTEQQHVYSTSVHACLADLENLHAAKIIKGNYELKLARQEYFLSKQQQLVEQLLLQHSRNHFTTLVYELEAQRHRANYHLLVSAKTLLEKERVPDRISLLRNDPRFKEDSPSKSTILSKDKFANRIYEAIVPIENHDTLYRTYEKIFQHSREVKNSEDTKQNINELSNSVVKIERLFSKNIMADQNEVYNLTEKLEERLAESEDQVNAVISDIVAKRKLLATDSMKSLERDAFAQFFNDPQRLKRVREEVAKRVNNIQL